MKAMASLKEGIRSYGPFTIGQRFEIQETGPDWVRAKRKGIYIPLAFVDIGCADDVEDYPEPDEDDFLD